MLFESKKKKHNHKKLNKKRVENENCLSDEQIIECLNNILNHDNWNVSIPLLKKFLSETFISHRFYNLIQQVLLNFNIEINQQILTNPEHIEEIIKIFFDFVNEDYDLTDFLVENEIHIIFFKFIRLDSTILLFQELLLNTKPPHDFMDDFKENKIMNNEEIESDHDKRQIQYEEFCLKNGYNIVAKFCIENDIAQIFLELFDLNYYDPILLIETIYGFGHYFYSYPSFKPVIDYLFNIFFNTEDIDIKCGSLESIAKFVCTRKESLYQALSFPDFKKIFNDVLLDQINPELIDVLLLFILNSLKLKYYLDNNDIIMFISFAFKVMCASGNIQDNGKKSSIMIKSFIIFDKCSSIKGKSEEYIHYYMNNGIIEAIYSLVNKDNPFKIQRKAIQSICRFFTRASNLDAQIMWGCQFLDIISDYITLLDKNNIDLMFDIVESLARALHLSMVIPELSSWAHLINESVDIIESLSNLECSQSEIGHKYSYDSIEATTHRFLSDLSNFCETH